MTRILYDIKLTLTLEAPYLVHGSDPGRFGLDATLLSDHRGRPVLPGTLLAGRIAEVWAAHGTDLGNADADLWFGKRGIDAADGAQRARLRVEDLVLVTVDGAAFDAKAARHDFDASRIRQDDSTGAVERGALLIVEQLGRPGARLGFHGTWQSWAEAAEIDTLCNQLRAALLLQTQLGAYRSIGFGRMFAMSVAASKASHQPLHIDGQHECQRFALTTDDALCVGARSRRGNVFESGDIISGGTLRGALAQMLMARHGVVSLDKIGLSPLAKYFEKLRCTHALPAPIREPRPLPLPQSLVWHDDDVKDAWRHKSPPAELMQAPAFQTDWKPKAYEKAGGQQGWGKTQRHLRVRTDIGPDGKAKDGKLFAYECVAAARDSADKATTQWLFDIDLVGIGDATDRAAVWVELDNLLGGGLAPLGKTDAHATLQAIAKADPASNSAWAAVPLDSLTVGNLVPLLLVTDALLFPTDAIADQPEADLGGIYRDAFADLLDKLGCKSALSLSHHFATQRLAGGDYLHKRYLKGKDYQPFVLTEAGSVFVFEVNDVANARLALHAWGSNGLALPTLVSHKHGDTWQHHPYLPQNGFGEVAVHPAHGFSDL